MLCAVNSLIKHGFAFYHLRMFQAQIDPAAVQRGIQLSTIINRQPNHLQLGSVAGLDREKRTTGSLLIAKVTLRKTRLSSARRPKRTVVNHPSCGCNRSVNGRRSGKPAKRPIFDSVAGWIQHGTVL
jgi:hypothetical protein